ncbi:MAG: NrfD/PsrC family molybdoenzyme membrane anchor subunit [Acidobacteriota bacterium]|nr:NrfD/PsrC family molybdoenzyme membrane anchor subunit [Acidobacteriota bacterium]
MSLSQLNPDNSKPPGAKTFHKVDQDVLRTLQPGALYFSLLGVCLILIAFGAWAWSQQVRHGLGVTGLKHPVMWGAYITTFVFWVGIAHSGTLISAILFLFRARWRAAISRASEAMTVFAVMTAGLFPIIHLGRPWLFYWLIPYPNERTLWVNFRSPLVWDVFAVGTYFTVSAVFFYIGLIPDLAVLRDNATGWKRRIFAITSLGWSGTGREWKHFSSAYLFLAALATPLVVSVHSIVSWDFAVAIIPGWHSTIFAPYFVAGAIFSGLAMVLSILIPARSILKLEEYITMWHLENISKLIIVSSLIVSYSYLTEFFFAWYSQNPFEQTVFLSRAVGDFAPLFWLMVMCNCLTPLLLFFKSVRCNTTILFIVSILINIGMWTERFVIIAGSLAREYSRASWDTYNPSWVEWSILLASFAWFAFWFLLFIRHLPAIPLAEVKESIHRSFHDHLSNRQEKNL